MATFQMLPSGFAGSGLSFKLPNPTLQMPQLPRGGDTSAFGPPGGQANIIKSDDGPRQSFPNVTHQLYVSTIKANIQLPTEAVATSTDWMPGDMCFVDTTAFEKNAKFTSLQPSSTRMTVVGDLYRVCPAGTFRESDQQHISYEQTTGADHGYKNAPPGVNSFNLNGDFAENLRYCGVIRNEAPANQSATLGAIPKCVENMSRATLVALSISKYAFVRNYWANYGPLVNGTRLFLFRYKYVTHTADHICHVLHPWTESGIQSPITAYNRYTAANQPTDTNDRDFVLCTDAYAEREYICIGTVLVCTGNTTSKELIQVDLANDYDWHPFKYRSV